MSTLYFGFGISDSMFADDVQQIKRTVLKDVDYVNYLLNNPTSLFCQKMVPCLNPSHKATIDAMVSKYGIEGIEIPSIAPKINLESGDRLIVMSPRGLPRLQDRHEYIDEEVEKATFTFAIYCID